MAVEVALPAPTRLAVPEGVVLRYVGGEPGPVAWRSAPERRVTVVAGEFEPVLREFLARLRRSLGPIEVYDLGILNRRLTRGGSRISQHAYAAAYDWAGVAVRRTAGWTVVPVRHASTEWPQFWTLARRLLRYLREAHPGLTVLGPEEEPKLHSDHVHIGLYPRRVTGAGATR